MPDYDEYGMGYKDRSVLFHPRTSTKPSAGGEGFNRMIIINGRVEGSWKRTLVGNAVQVKVVPLTSWTKAKKREIRRAVERYSLFLGKELIMDL